MTKRILFVDNLGESLKKIKLYIDHSDADIETAEIVGAEEGLCYMALSCFDLVIVEQDLPGMKGDEFIVAAQKINKGIPTFLISEYGTCRMKSSEELMKCSFVFFTHDWALSLIMTEVWGILNLHSTN